MKVQKASFLFLVAMAFLVAGCIPKHPTKTTRPDALAGPWQERTVVSSSGHEYSYLFAPGPSEDAPAMVLLSGGFFDDRIWLYADGLAKRFNVYALDWPSNSLFFTGRVEDFGDIALDFVDALGLDEIYLAGVSMGTFAAVDVASRPISRARVKALVLASTVMFAITEDEVALRTKYGRMALGFAPERMRSIVEWRAGRAELPRADGPIQQEEIFWVRPYSYYYQVFSMMVNQGDQKQDTMAVSCPVLFLHGTKDETMPVDTARQNPEVFKDAAWVELEGKTHSMVFSDGPLIVEKIEDFLKSRDLLP